MYPIIKSLVLFFIVFLYLLLISSPVYAQESIEIRVTGFDISRSSEPLISDEGGPYIDYFFLPIGSENLGGALLNENNFGPNGVVPCGVNYQMPTSYVQTGSLVDPNNNLKSDIFFASTTNQNLAEEEIQELAKFVNLGGIVYMAGDESPVNEGLPYNLFLENLGFNDRFLEPEMVPNGSEFTSDPPDITPTTNGPFGQVGSLWHKIFRVIDVQDAVGLAQDTTTSNYFLAESKFGQGYFVLVGEPIHINFYMTKTGEIKRYFENLFAMACDDSWRNPGAKVLDVPSSKQGLTPYDGVEPIWENVVYDHGDQQVLSVCDTNGDGAKMYECACALTSATMVMRYNDIDKLWYNDEITPESVNDYFKQFSTSTGNYYESYGFSGGNVLWSAISGLTADSNVIHSTPKLDQPVREDFDLEKIKQYIDDKVPVVQQVTGKFGIHWVVIKGYEPNTNRLIINDPAYPDPPPGHYSYLDELYTPNTSQSMITYVKTFSDFRYLEIVSPSSQNILVTDQNGNKTGYDPILGQVEQIPNSQYIFEGFYGNPANTEEVPPSAEGMYVLTIRLPSDGGYKLEVVGGSAPKAITVYSSNVAGKRISDFIVPEAEAEYNLEYLEATAGQEVNIEKIVEEIEIQVDIVPFTNKNIIIPHKWIPVSVAILASDTFDVNKIDQSSLTFGKTGDEGSFISCGNKLVDVNRDRKKDLICFYAGDKLGLDTPDTEATLKGSYEGGIRFVGKDTVKVVKPWFLF